jgi:hypothetical protein
MRSFVKVFLSGLISAFLAFSATAPANADDAPDQQVINSLNWYSCLSSTNRIGQSFAPTSSGDLTKITINPFADGNPGDLIVSIYASSSDVPTGEPLATKHLGQNSIPDRNTELGGNPRPVTQVVFDAPISVQSGQRYYIVLSAPNAVYDMINEVSNSYCLMREQDVLTSEKSIGGSVSSWDAPADWDLDFATYITYAEEGNTLTSDSLSNTGGTQMSLIVSGIAVTLLGAFVILMVRKLRLK